MILMCTGCYEKVEYYNIKMSKTFHPYNVDTCDCGGKVCDMDELIFPTIQTLNKKGWTTAFCCSGHLDEGFINTYIKFTHMPDSLPSGFYKDGDCIRHHDGRREDATGLNGFVKLSNINMRLYKWALSLPENS